MITDELKSELSKLEAQLAQLEPLKTRAALIAELLKSYEPNGNHSTVPARGPYSRLGLKDTISAVMVANQPNLLTLTAILAKMKAGGYTNPSPNLRAMVSATCKRKCESDHPEFEAGKLAGETAYRLKARQDATS